MKVTLSLDKSIEENASDYFEKAKTSKRKLEGTLKAAERTRRELEKARTASARLEEEGTTEKRKPAKQEWYERFRWFISSEGVLCIGGRDATTNEMLIKKHAEEKDTVLHCDIAGSPFFVIKTDGDPGEATVEEAAVATGSYSKAWRLGLGSIEVYAVKAGQLSKEAPAGEYLTKGSFMIRGKRRGFAVVPRLAVALKEGKVIAGPVRAVSSRAERYVEIVPGNTKTSAVAKEIKRLIAGGELDDIIRMLPAGGSKVATGSRHHS